jgi:hypothetical protein
MDARVNELEPIPLEEAVDMVTFVAVMVKLGVMASAGAPESVTVRTARIPRIARRRTLCIAAKTFLRRLASYKEI